MKQIKIIHLLIIFLFPLTSFALSPTVDSAPKSIEAIEDLVSPIALYPDILLASLLPAATFPDQLTDAFLLIRDQSDAELIAKQSWDESVKIIATYPGILKMMYEKLVWTTDLGEAFLNQSQQVMSAIQQKRLQAQSAGNLKTNQQQKVSTQYVQQGNPVIVIEPKDPQVIYVETSYPSTVYTSYVEPPSYVAPLVTFGLGMAVGAALADNDNDYYYHSSSSPWGGNIWVNNSYHNDWYDAKRDQQEFVQDRVQKEQNFRHDRVSEQQDFRNDRVSDKQDFRQEQIKNNNFSDQRQAKLNQARTTMSQSGFYSAKASVADTTNNFSNANKNLSSSTVNTTRSSFSSKQASYTNKASNRGYQSRSLATTQQASRSMSGTRSLGGGGGFRRR